MGFGAVLNPHDQRSLGADGLGDFAYDWFSRGLLTWTSGPNAGRSMEVMLHSKSPGNVTVVLWHGMAEAIAVGHAFTITAGCDKQFLTCRAKFNNVANFRGFPHVPGNDFMLSVATRDGKNGGGSRFG